ncbi:MAG: hypothetical protein LBI49_22800, partial [Nocardiopsaceae bacterium]|nr:hypothetical protein [Nocardiopsaceae bacterium]
MSASDAVPLPRLGEVFFDVRGDSRTMRLSWYADTGVAVFSIWQGGTCTGTFRLPIGDLPRMVEALQGGPSGRGQRPRGGQPGPGASRLPGPPGPGPVPAPEDEVATGMWRPADEDFQPAAGGYRDEAGSGGYGTGALDPPRPGRSAGPGAELPGFGEDLGSDGYPPLGSGGFPAGAGSGTYRTRGGSGAFPGDDAGSGGFPGGSGSGGFRGDPGSGG